MERISTAARELGCHLEINSQPERLDLNDAHIHTARQAGANSTDAFAWIRFGIDQARRGWLTAGDVIDTRSLPDLRNRCGASVPHFEFGKPQVRRLCWLRSLSLVRPSRQALQSHARAHR